MNQSKTITSIAELIGEIPSLRNLEDEGSLFYRGEKCQFPMPCTPMLYRKSAWVKRERYFHNELLHCFPDAARDLTTDLERMVLMQHYGFPTRLLDVTESPLVALFFTVFGDRDDADTDDKDGVVYCIKVPYKGIHYERNDDVMKIAELVRKGNDFRLEPPDDYRKILFIKPPWKNDRIRAQQGEMLLFGCDGHKENPVKLSESEDEHSPFLHQKWLIPAACKKMMRKDLRDLGIHRWTLFPDIEHLAAELKTKTAKRKLDS